MKLIDNYIYFYHLDKFCILPTYPDTLADVMGTNFQSQNALSRTSPVFTYVNSGPRTMSITLGLHRDMLRDINVDSSNFKPNVVAIGEDYVDILIKYLMAAAVPRYNIYTSQDKNVIPPMVAIRFGNQVFIKGVINSGITVTYKKPIMVDGKYACADVSFSISETDPYDADSILKYGSFRGCVGGFVSGIYNTSNDKITYGGEFGGEFVNVSTNTSASSSGNTGDYANDNKTNLKVRLGATEELATGTGNGPYTQDDDYNIRGVINPQTDPQWPSPGGHADIYV